MNTAAPVELKPADFSSDQEVRWCPGCGDYAILKAVQRTLPRLGVPREKYVFVSGIGCSSRFPYYMSTYGFHTIHGRGPAIASGVKVANPDLDVWLVTGDGDGLSIGGNHLIHLLRRNVDMQVLLFNNEIYGLTKGQYSPTSRRGTRSPSTPRGSVEHPLNAGWLALGAGTHFLARGIDTDKTLVDVLERAHDHKGTSLVEIMQNCIVFNDRTFEAFTDRSHAAERQLRVEHGKPMIFGAEKNRGLRLKPGTLKLESVTVGEAGVSVDDILVHDETDRTLAALLVGLKPPEFPFALGVLFCDPAATYETMFYEQVGDERSDLDALLHQGRTWMVS
jgi:2-oxoglutarate ferredoxin oxidoreductase subunit beta